MTKHMEVILAVIRPKSSHNGLDYKSKYYDILLLDHRNIDKHGKATKFLPSFKLTHNDEEPREKVLTQLYLLTGSEHGGIKGERALLVPWNEKEGYRDSLSHYALYFIPVSSRDKLNSSFVDKSPSSPGFYSLESMIHSINTASMNFPVRTQTFIMHLESWLKDKHLRNGSLDILFRSRADFRISLSVSNPVFFPVDMGLSESPVPLRNDIPNEIRIAANEYLAKMMSVEKCNKVVINTLFGSGLSVKPRSRQWPMVPHEDYPGGINGSSTTSRKSSLESSIDPDNFPEPEQSPLHVYASMGDVQKLQEFISRGHMHSNGNDFGWTPIHCAVWYGHSNAVQVLLTAGCSPNVVNPEDRTPLHLAALKGYPNVAEVLLNHPEIDINALDKQGRTPLEVCKQGRSVQHDEVARKIEMASRQPRQIEVLLMDGERENLNLTAGANTSVQQLNQQMLRKFDMPETPYADIFTIWICSPCLELQLKPEHKPIEHMNSWKRRIVGMLTDADPNKEEPHLKWRRNAKISLIIEREVIHPKAINLLYHEAKQNYLKAMYPCKEQDVLVLTSLLLYIKHGSSPSAAKAFLSKNLQSLVPSPMLNARSRSNWSSKIHNHYKEFSNKLGERTDSRFRSKQYLQTEFLRNCRNLTVYGSAFFTGILQQGNARTDVKCFIGVNDVGLHIINYNTRLMLHSYKYSEISWQLPPTDYAVLEVLVVRTDSRGSERHSPRNQLKLRTKQAGMINHLMRKLSHITYGIVYSRSVQNS